MPVAGWIGRFMRGRPPNNSLHTNRRLCLAVGRASGFFGRWFTASTRSRLITTKDHEPDECTVDNSRGRLWDGVFH